MTINHQPYVSYSETGYSWVPSIPSHWDAAKLARFARVATGGTPDRERLEYWSGGDIPWLASGEVNKGIIWDVEGRITRLGMQNSNARLVPANSVVVALNGQGKTKGITALLKVPSTCNQSIAAIIPDGGRLDPTFLYYYTSAKYLEIRGMAGEQRDGLSLSDIRAMPVVVPPLSEQLCITDFLDRETAKLDGLIHTKRRLVQLIADKQRQVIADTLERGTGPTVRLKYASTRIVDTEHKTVPFFSDGEYLVVRTSNVRFGRLLFEGAKYTNSAGYQEWTRRAVPAAGDILFTREAPAGEACVVPADTPLCLGQRMVLIKPDPVRLDPEFAVFALYGSRSVREFVTLLSQGSTVEHFNMADIGNIPVPLPSIPVQKQTVGVLKASHAKENSAVAAIKLGLQRLCEYRSALITAAVTGQIDVTTRLGSTPGRPLDRPA